MFTELNAIKAPKLIKEVAFSRDRPSEIKERPPIITTFQTGVFVLG